MTVTATECACMPGKVCAPCSARGYESGLAGYAARIYPQQVTPADVAREDGVHYVAPESSDDLAPYDSCELCRKPVRLDSARGWVTMVGFNRECYGRR